MLNLAIFNSEWITIFIACDETKILNKNIFGTFIEGFRLYFHASKK